MSNLLAQQAGNALSSMAGAIDFSALVSAGKAVASSSKDLMGEAHYFEETVTVRAGLRLRRRELRAGRAGPRARRRGVAPPFLPPSSLLSRPWVAASAARETTSLSPPAPPRRAAGED